MIILVPAGNIKDYKFTLYGIIDYSCYFNSKFNWNYHDLWDDVQ